MHYTVEFDDFNFFISLQYIYLKNIILKDWYKIEDPLVVKTLKKSYLKLNYYIKLLLVGCRVNGVRGGGLAA